jgi:hypothetical protein
MDDQCEYCGNGDARLDYTPDGNLLLCPDCRARWDAEAAPDADADLEYEPRSADDLRRVLKRSGHLAPTEAEAAAATGGRRPHMSDELRDAISDAWTARTKGELWIGTDTPEGELDVEAYNLAAAMADSMAEYVATIDAAQTGGTGAEIHERPLPVAEAARRIAAAMELLYFGGPARHDSRVMPGT